MGYTFTATVNTQSEDSSVFSNVTIYQTVADGAKSPIAYISDSLSCGDLRSTTIRFAGGTLNFRVDYDMYLQAVSSHPFLDEANGTVLSLEEHLNHPLGLQFFLRDASGLYPIHIASEGTSLFTQIAVYKPTPIANSDGLKYPILALITQVQKYDSGFTYEIQAEVFPSLAFLVAVFSLPFTAGATGVL